MSVLHNPEQVMRRTGLLSRFEVRAQDIGVLLPDLSVAVDASGIGCLLSQPASQLSRQAINECPRAKK